MQNPAETVRNWFRLADIDQDGLLEGHEAVSFFKRSGLDANILAQIWEYAARGSSSLGLAQFWTAIQLVSLAQRGAKPFQDHFASVAEGSHPHLPLPRMDGLGGSSQPLQGSSVIPDSGTTGGSVSSSYSTHPHPDTWPQGHAVLSSAPLAAPRSTSHSGGLPPMSAEDHGRYRQAFRALDSDSDGWVTGGECLPEFARTGLPRETLKAIWDVVAGSRGSLSASEFVKAMYLADCARKGFAVPASLPPEPFPPTLPAGHAWSTGGVSAPSQAPYSYGVGAFGGEGSAVARSKQPTVEVPQIPDLEVLEPMPAPEGGASALHNVPEPDAACLKSLPSDQRERLETELKEARDAAEKLSGLEAKSAEASRRASHYREQLSSLRIAKTRVDTVIMQASEKAKKHQTEAEAVGKRYNAAVKALQAEHGDAMALMERGADAVRRWREAEERLQALHGQIQQAAAAAPQNPVKDPVVEALSSQAQRKRREVAALEAKAKGLKHQAELLRGKISSCQTGASRAAAFVSDAKQKLHFLRQRAAAPGAAPADKNTVLDIVQQIHGMLAQHASAAGLPVPHLAQPPAPDAVLAPSGPQCWLATNGDGSAWVDFADEGINAVGAVQPMPSPLLWDDAKAGPQALPPGDSGASAARVDDPAAGASPWAAFDSEPQAPQVGGSAGWAQFDAAPADGNRDATVGPSTLGFGDDAGWAAFGA